MFLIRLSTHLLAGTAMALALNAPVFAAQQAEEKAEQAADPDPQQVLSAPDSKQIPTITVEGQAFGDFKVEKSGIAKLTEPLRDVPQSISTVSREVIEQRGVTNLNDAFRNVPGITLGAGEFTWQGNNPNIRGFNSRSDMFLDGMRDFGSYSRDPFNTESVEVLQGPASMVFGRGSTGGVVNQVTKQPTLDSDIVGALNFGTDTTKRVTADINQPLPELGDGGAVRLNVMGHDGEMAGRDGGKTARYGFAPSLALGLDTPTRLTLNYLHQTANDVPDYGLPWFGTSVAEVPRKNFYGFSSDYSKTTADIVTAKVDHDFSDDLELHSQLRYAHYTRSSRIAEPLIAATIPTTMPIANVTVIRNMYTGRSAEDFLNAQADATIKFVTGLLQHAVVAGLELGRERSAPFFGFAQGVPSTNLLTPSIDQIFSSTGTPPTIISDTTGDSVGVFALDTVRFDEMFQVIGGLRWDSFRVDYSADRYNTSTGAIASSEAIVHVDREFSYRAAAVFKPMPEGTIYFGFGTSFNPSAESLTFLVNARNFNIGNAFLEPEENRTFELGTKWDLMDGKLSANAAVFRIVKENARVPNPTTPGFNTLGGTQRAQGFDVGVTGSLTHSWQVTAGYVYLDTAVTKSVAGAAPVGAPLLFAPKSAVSFWTAVLVTDKIQLGTGGQFSGRRFATNTEPIKSVPGYWTFDAMGRYLWSGYVSFKLNLTNLTDKYYYDAIHPWHVIPGAGRTATFAINLHY